jgi:hypothetical protein
MRWVERWGWKLLPDASALFCARAPPGLASAREKPSTIGHHVGRWIGLLCANFAPRVSAVEKGRERKADNRYQKVDSSERMGSSDWIGRVSPYASRREKLFYASIPVRTSQLLLPGMRSLCQASGRPDTYAGLARFATRTGLGMLVTFAEARRGPHPGRSV